MENKTYLCIDLKSFYASVECAATMPNQIPDKIKTERSAVIRNISAENKKRYFKQMLGKTQKMLIERVNSDGIALGYGENYIPMRLKSKSLEKNTFVDVRVDSIIGDARYPRHAEAGRLRAPRPVCS